MNNVCAATNCDHPTDTYLCNNTITDLERLLAETPWLVHELETTRAKLNRFAEQGGKVSTKSASTTESKLEGVAVQPLIINAEAGDALASLTATLLSWQANLADALGTPVRYPNATRSAAWMMGNLNNISVFIAAGDLYDEIVDSHKHARKLIDRPADRLYLGDCNSDIDDVFCSEPLFGNEREATATCKACGTVWPQDARLVVIREQASKGLRDRIMTASEAAGVLIAYNITDSDQSKMTDRIRKWAEQPKDPNKKPKLTKRVDLRHVGERSRPGYRFGDILDIVHSGRKSA